MPMPESNMVKIMMFIKKKPEIESELFRKHWWTTHVDIAMSNPIFREKVQRFSQVYISPDLNEQAASFGSPILPFDGIVEFSLKSLDDWKFIVKDTEFVSRMKADEMLFMEPLISVAVGYENLVISMDEIH